MSWGNALSKKNKKLQCGRSYFNYSTDIFGSLSAAENDKGVITYRDEVAIG